METLIHSNPTIQKLWSLHTLLQQEVEVGVHPLQPQAQPQPQVQPLTAMQVASQTTALMNEASQIIQLTPRPQF